MIDEQLVYSVLGEKIRKLREAQLGGRGRMTQLELAEMVGLERTSITNIERGNQKVPLHVLFKICEALKSPMIDVLPKTAEVQVAKWNLPLEDLHLNSGSVKATPLVKQAVVALLNGGRLGDADSN
jgi:transcriptional regulator with XRE-family HTH domain